MVLCTGKKIVTSRNFGRYAIELLLNIALLINRILTNPIFHVIVNYVVQSRSYDVLCIK